MSISTHINEYTSVSDFLSDVSAYDGTDIEAVEKFLRETYPDDNSADDYDMDKGSNDPQFTIKVIDNSMDDYAEENLLRIHLPSRKAADELADMLNGTVTYDGSKKPKAKKAKKRKPLYIVSVARFTKNARSLLAAKDKQVKLWVLPRPSTIPSKRHRNTSTLLSKAIPSRPRSSMSTRTPMTPSTRSSTAPTKPVSCASPTIPRRTSSYRVPGSPGQGDPMVHRSSTFKGDNMNTFTPDVAKAIFDYTRQNPRNAKAELAESVWGFGFTKDTPRKMFSLSKMFLSCQHVTTGQNVYFGFTIEPGDEP